MKKPNVVMIISDQWSMRTCDGSGNYNNGIETPAIDSLASGGIRFEQSYSSFPLCCPSRGSIFTGMMPHNHNIIQNEEEYIDQIGYIPQRSDITTLGEELKKTDYETAYFGKEHAGNYGWEGIDNFGSMKYSSGGMLAEGSAFDSIFTKDAIDFINKEHDKPFYMTLSLINPHDICKVLGGKVKGATFADAIFFCRDNSEPYLRFQQRPNLPDNFDIPTLKGMVKENDYMYEEMNNITEDEWKRYISTYQLLIEKTDWNINLVLKSLKDKGLDEDTIVIFTTDHGDMLGSHRLIAKTNFYEESVKTQMIIRYPKQIKEAQINKKHLISTIDIMPTILDLCNIDIPQDIDGRSFKNLCIERECTGFDNLFSENPFGKMYRFDNYKYIRTIFDDKEYEILIDLEKDPQEATNYFNKKGYEKISKKARAELYKWMEEGKLKLTF